MLSNKNFKIILFFIKFILLLAHNNKNNHKKGKIMKRKITFLMLSILSSISFADTTPATTSTKASATLASSCQIQMQSISFGALMLPITTQQASSNMTVLCTKETPYTIDMSYGVSTLILYSRNANGHTYAYDTVTKTTSAWPADTTGYVLTDSNVAYGVNGCDYPYGCTSYTKAGTTANMQGATKGDAITYRIVNPTDSTKSWDSTNKYADKGTGANQSILVKAELIPSSPNQFPAPDSYSGTLTTTLTY